MLEEDNTLEELMHKAQNGDKLAYGLVLQESAKILRGFLINKLGNMEDVEDVLQEILVSVHKSRHTYDKSRAYKPWLYSIAKFRLCDFFRKVYKKNEHEVPLSEEMEKLNSEDVTEQSDDYELLNEAIAKLPQKQQDIIRLMKFEGYTAKEVASKLDMNESAVKVSAHRAYKLIKENMTKPANS